MNQKRSFVLYYDNTRIFQYLDDCEAGKLIKAIFAYVNEGVSPNFDGVLAMGFDILHNQLRRDAERWEDIRRKRAEAGRKSGRVRRENKAIREQKQA